MKCLTRCGRRQDLKLPKNLELTKPFIIPKPDNMQWFEYDKKVKRIVKLLEELDVEVKGRRIKYED